MGVSIPRPSPSAVVYPESDGKPIAENTQQFRWIMVLKEGLEAAFRDDPEVFVAGDLLWYPVEGDNKTRIAPDAMVAFGRPKGDRGCYKQWEEGGIAPQVVFEVLSSGNRPREMAGKLRFYERFGVEEYYVYDPDTFALTGWRREGDAFEKVPDLSGFVSPRLGIRFEPGDGELRIYGPDDEPFVTFVELVRQRNDERARADGAQTRAMEFQAQIIEAQNQAAELQAQTIEAQARIIETQGRIIEAKNQAAGDRARAEQAEARAEALARRLRELGLDPDA